MVKLIASVILIAVTQFVQANQAFSIYLVRHAHKQIDQGKDPNLTTKGEQTATSLAALLENVNIEAIYSTDYKRTQQTAAPLTNKLGLQVSSYDPRKLEAFAQQVLSKRQDILVVGHSNTTPGLITALGGVGKPIDESRYGDVYQLVYWVTAANDAPQLIKQTKLTIPGAP